MTSETRTLKEMYYFQLVDNQVMSTQGQPDVNLMSSCRLTCTALPRGDARRTRRDMPRADGGKTEREGQRMAADKIPFF